MTMLKLMSILAVFGLATACNTIEGAGEDVSAAGNAIDESAEENNTYGR